MMKIIFKKIIRFWLIFVFLDWKRIFYNKIQINNRPIKYTCRNKNDKI